jgi:hypothetical protein
MRQVYYDFRYRVKSIVAISEDGLTAIMPRTGRISESAARLPEEVFHRSSKSAILRPAVFIPRGNYQWHLTKQPAKKK